MANRYGRSIARTPCVVASLLSLLVPVNLVAQEPLDIVIASGMILDGAGNPFVVADVGIAGERIVEIGRIDTTRARRVIDATGLYVTPGFIDMHSHSANGDGSISHPEGRRAANSVTQGITTEAITSWWKWRLPPASWGDTTTPISAPRAFPLSGTTHAIRGMTSLAAQIIGLKNRGLLREGFYADVNVIDPVTISDRATYMNPHEYSTGFRFVLINGEFVVDDGERTGALVGKVLLNGEL